MHLNPKSKIKEITPYFINIWKEVINYISNMNYFVYVDKRTHAYSFIFKYIVSNI